LSAADPLVQPFQNIDFHRHRNIVLTVNGGQKRQDRNVALNQDIAPSCAEWLLVFHDRLQ
jgi:uncharacterized protein Veg